MIKIGICDDDIDALNKIENCISKYFSNSETKFEVTSYTKGTEIENIWFDIILLDIEMLEINGIEVAKKCQAVNNDVIIFFVTDYEEYLDDAFDISAFRYLKKPINEKRLFYGLNQAIEKINKLRRNIVVKYKNSEIVIPIEKIIYAEIEKRGINIFTTKGKYRVIDNLKNFKAQVSEDIFIQTHGSFIVNLNFVIDFNETTVILEYDSNIYNVHMSRRMFANFKDKFIKYIGSN